MSVNLDQIEALAKAALSPKCTCCASGGYRSNCGCDQEWLEAALNPAVVLQWVAETRALQLQRDDSDRVRVAALVECNTAKDTLEDSQAALRVAVEALERCRELALGSEQQIVRIANTALDEIKKLSGGQGER